MDSLRKVAMEALEACGIDASWAEGNRWLTINYGKNHNVSESTYYKARQEVKKRQPPVVVSNGKEQPVVEKEVTFSEMRKVFEFCRENGGAPRVIHVIKCLENLGN